MDSLERQISVNIRKEIEQSGRSKTEIAALLGVAKPTLSQYLSGRIMPSLPTFARLCAILDCSPEDILETKKITID